MQGLLKQLGGRAYSREVAAQLQRDVEQFRDQSVIEAEVGSMQVELGRARSAVDEKRRGAVAQGNLALLREANEEAVDLGLETVHDAELSNWEGEREVYAGMRERAVTDMPHEVLRLAENPEAEKMPAEFARLGKATWGELRLRARESLYGHQRGMMEDFREAVRSSTVRDDADAEVWAQMHVPEGMRDATLGPLMHRVLHGESVDMAFYISNAGHSRKPGLNGLRFARISLRVPECTVYFLMPVASETSRIQYTGNDSSVTPYSVPFSFLSDADIKVVLADADGVETLLAETTHYALTGAGEPTGGSLTTLSAYDDTHTLTIYREPQQTQSAEFQSTGALPADALTRGLDKLTMLVQSLARKLGRCFRFNDKADAVDALSEAARANTVFGFGAVGEPALRNRVDLLSLLSLSGSLQGAPTAFWMNDGERALKVPDFTGQIGVQLDEDSLWRSSGAGAGAWSLLLLDEDEMSSDSARRPPSQRSVKAYVDALPLDEDDFASDSAARPPTQQSAKAYMGSYVGAYLPAGVMMDYVGATAPEGWLLCDGRTIGSAASGATSRAHADTLTLYTLLWIGWGNAELPIQDSAGALASRGASVGDDFAANKRLPVPDLRGRVTVGKDNMGGSAANRVTSSGTGNPGITGTVLGAAVGWTGIS